MPTLTISLVKRGISELVNCPNVSSQESAALRGETQQFCCACDVEQLYEAVQTDYELETYFNPFSNETFYKLMTSNIHSIISGETSKSDYIYYINV